MSRIWKKSRKQQVERQKVHLYLQIVVLEASFRMSPFFKLNLSERRTSSKILKLIGHAEPSEPLVGILFFFHETDESNLNMGQGKALNYNVVDAYAKLLALLVRYMNGGGTTELLNLIESKKAVVRKQQSEIKTN